MLTWEGTRFDLASGGPEICWGWGMTSANDSSFGDHGPCADVSGESSNEEGVTLPLSHGGQFMTHYLYYIVLIFTETVCFILPSKSEAIDYFASRFATVLTV